VLNPVVTDGVEELRGRQGSRRTAPNVKRGCACVGLAQKTARSAKTAKYAFAFIRAHGLGAFVVFLMTLKPYFVVFVQLSGSGFPISQGLMSPRLRVDYYYCYYYIL
jgi:hypothetical protein